MSNDIYIIKKNNENAINDNNSPDIVIDRDNHNVWKLDLNLMIANQTFIRLMLTCHVSRRYNKYSLALGKNE